MTDARDAVPDRGSLGVFGGMFDPVHEGHLHLANTLATELELNEVRMVPCAAPPHRGKPQASAQDRCNMLRLALEPYPKLHLDTRELQRQELSYTVDTLNSLRDEGYSPIYLLLGGDAFASFCNWHKWRDILRLACLAVAERPGSATQISPAMQKYECGTLDEMKNAGAGKVCLLSIEALDVSSSVVRDGKLDHVPPAVASYITRNKLYRHD